jgi:hypothetical protein
MDETLRPEGTGGLDHAQLERQMRGQRAQERRRVEDLPAEEAPTLVTCPVRGRTTASTARGELIA